MEFCAVGFEAYVQVLHPLSGRRAPGALARGRRLPPGAAQSGSGLSRFWGSRDAWMQRDGQRRWAAPIPGEVPDQVLDLLVPVLGDGGVRTWMVLSLGRLGIHHRVDVPHGGVATHQPPPPGRPVSARALPAFSPGILKGRRYGCPIALTCCLKDRLKRPVSSGLSSPGSPQATEPSSVEARACGGLMIRAPATRSTPPSPGLAAADSSSMRFLNTQTSR